MEPKDFDYKQFFINGELGFPYSIRTYIDSCASEFDDITLNQKLFHFAFLFNHGVAVKSIIEDDIQRHMENPQYGGYLDTARLTIADYICYVRSNFKDDYLGEVLLKDLPLDELLDLLRDELLLRYREYVNDWDLYGSRYLFKSCKYDLNEITERKEFKDAPEKLKAYFLTPKETLRNIELTDDDIRLMNGWRFVARHLDYQYLQKDGQQFIYPGDEKAIETCNKRRGESTRFHIEVTPEPFWGNVLNAKVVLLSCNPGFVKEQNYKGVKAMDEGHREQYTVPMREQLRLESHGFFKYEEQEKVDSMYWYNCLRLLNEDAYDGRCDGDKYDWPVCRNVAVIQYLGYPASSWAELPKKVRFQSQWFTKLLIYYLAKKSGKTLFVITRSRKSVSRWLEFLGEDMVSMLGDRLIYRDTELPTGSISQYITPKNIGPNNYRTIVDALKE